MLAVQKWIVRQTAPLGELFSCQPVIRLSHFYLPRTVFKSQSVITVMSVYTQDPVDIFTEFAVRNPQYAVRVFYWSLWCSFLRFVYQVFFQNLIKVTEQFYFSVKLMLKLLQIAWPTVVSLWTRNELRKIGMGSITGFLERGSGKGLTDNWHLVKI